jgi:glutathione S-transferase
MSYTLVVGSKQVSSWSLRPWMLMRQAGIAFEEVVIPLRGPGTRAEILKHSPSGQVPLLKDGRLAVWDSLAIAEYLHEKHADKELWPADATARAWARCISAEMHSSFREMRYGLPMEFSSRGLKPAINEQCAKDITRVVAIWTTTRKRFGAGGPFLFGAFTIADAMFAPVASRFTTFAPKLADYGDDGSAAAYRDMMMALPTMQDWGAAAAKEPPPPPFQ